MFTPRLIVDTPHNFSLIVARRSSAAAVIDGSDQSDCLESNMMIDD